MVIIVLCSLSVPKIAFTYTKEMVMKNNVDSEIILAIAWTEREEEGGWTEVTYYPSGYASVRGEGSDRGYPKPEEGFFKVQDIDMLQRFFDLTRSALKEKPGGEQPEKGLVIGYHYQTVVRTNIRDVSYARDVIQADILGSPLNKVESRHNPKTALSLGDVKRERVGDLQWTPPRVPVVNNAVNETENTSH